MKNINDILNLCIKLNKLPNFIVNCWFFGCSNFLDVDISLCGESVLRARANINELKKLDELYFNIESVRELYTQREVAA